MTTDELEWQQTLTSNPCPAWCSSPANHGYDEVVANPNRLSRTHILDVGSLTTADGGHVFVDIWVDEEVDRDEESNLTTGEPYLVILAEKLRGQVSPTAEEARRSGTMLNDAAYRLQFFEDES